MTTPFIDAVFLDIDGVFNSIAVKPTTVPGCDYNLVAKKGPAYDQPCHEAIGKLDVVLVRRLNRLVVETGAKFVMSTSWRQKLTVEAIDHLLVECGLDGDVIDETPDLIADPYWRLEREQRGLPPQLMQRGYEIGEWLLAHPEAERAVIFDDADDMAELGCLLVQIDPIVGLQDIDVTRAIDVLRGSSITLERFRATHAPRR